MVLLVVFGVSGVLLLRQYEYQEKTITYLPVKNFEEPVARESKTVHLPPGQNYVKISIPFDAVAMNKYGDIVGSLPRDDGRLDLVLWSAGDTYNISEVTGQTFTQVLDVNDENEVLGVVKENDQVYLKGFAYRTVPETDQIQVIPLRRIDLRRFGLEDLTLETELTLDSSIGNVTGRKVKVRSIIDMTPSGIILADEDDEKDEEPSPASQTSENP